jgi:LuxR family maltose regulon positive regulatory protein
LKSRVARAGRVGNGNPAGGEVLLATKLYVPAPRDDLIARQELVARLDRGLRGPLVLVSAPAGSGKTTLLGSWHEAHPERPIAWVSLDPTDNDPARFWRYVIAALQGVQPEQPELGDHALALLRTPRLPSVEALVGVLINELAGLAADTVLVLDDYHVIETEDIHRGMSYLLDHIPPALHLAITTRGDPPLQLSRLRARGQLVEIRLDDLRFSAAEAGVFLENTMGLRLPAEVQALLAERTEGWAAGLQLAALGLRGHGDNEAFVRSLRGTDRFIADYLVEEVLHRQPLEVQVFLLQTSILDRLCGSLCDAVLKNHPGSGVMTGHAQDVLEYLERANLFLTPMDNERRWYRYHHLFADLLRRKLEQMLPETNSGETDISELHRRAAGWYREHNLEGEAIYHLLEANDFEQAAGLVAQVAEPLLSRGELITLRRWIEAIPEPLLLERPRLLVRHAWTLLLTGDMAAMERRLEEAERRATVEDRELISEVVTLRAMFALLRGDKLDAGALSEEALKPLPRSGFLRGLVMFNLGFTSMLTGELSGAMHAFARAADVAQESGNLLIAILSLCQVAELQALAGELAQAEATYEQARQLALEPDGRPLPMGSMVYAGLGELFRERGELDKAADYLEVGIALGEQWGELSIFEGLGTLARVRHAQGRDAEAVRALEQVEQFGRKSDSGLVRQYVTTSRARLALETGDLASARRWAEEQGLGPQDEIDFYHTTQYYILVKLLLADERPEDAEGLARRLLAQAEQTGRTRFAVEALILLALAQQDQGDVSDAVTILDGALARGREAGFVRLFADEGRPLAGLLAKWLESAHGRGATPALRSYTRRLLEVTTGDTQTGAGLAAGGEGTQQGPDARLIEPLRSQELAVLRLIAAGRSNQEIARTLVIALSTVKWHINNIYGKLGVKSRTQAVSRARELGLLSE